MAKGFDHLLCGNSPCGRWGKVWCRKDLKAGVGRGEAAQVGGGLA